MKGFHDAVQRLFAALCPLIGGAYGWLAAEWLTLNQPLLIILGCALAWIGSARLIRLLEVPE